MLSYQHHYHAGSLADIHKHQALIKVLRYLTRKERPLSYMETHSGRAFYDTSSLESQKTGEAQLGIEKLLAETDNNNDYYINFIKQIRIEMKNPHFYPGSPLIAKKLLRNQDELFLMELHPQEIKFLYGLRKLNGSKAHIHHRDGYEGVLALAPPRKRRGLVLVDPSYEMKTEYNQVADFCIKLHKKWPEVVIMVWYPLLRPGYHLHMKDKIISYFKSQSLEEGSLSIDEINFSDPQRILGSGVIIIGKHTNISSPI